MNADHVSIKFLNHLIIIIIDKNIKGCTLQSVVSYIFKEQRAGLYAVLLNYSIIIHVYIPKLSGAFEIL